MQDLTPVGLSEDGSRLILRSASGEEYAVAADARLRAALGGDRTTDSGSPPRSARPLERQMESALRPRDIQARIRAGESPEDVAAAAGTSVDSIMGFAMPVLAERAHVAQTAQKASVRRTGDSTAVARTLGLAAETYFSEHGLHEEDVEWDAWRRPDGRWSLVAEYVLTGTPRRAEFTHDLPGRYVVADNDDARRLTGQLPEAAAGPAEPQAVPRRLSAVRMNDEVPLGDDALELVRERQSQTGDLQPHEQEPAFEPTPEPLADEPAARQEPAGPETPVAPEPADVEDTAPVELPAEMPGELPADEPLFEQPAASEVQPDAGSAAEAESEASTARSEEQPAKPARSSRKKGRSSVPSWDEIMFGGGQND